MKIIPAKLLYGIRNNLYRMFYTIDRILKRKTRVIILCYHSISGGRWDFGLTLSEFKKQVNYLKDNYSFITADDLRLFLDGKKSLPDPSVLITFDDGYADILKVREYLKSENIKPLLFILADGKNVNRKETDTRKIFLQKRDLRRLIEDGWTVGCHTATHPDLSKLTPDEIKREINHARSILRKKFKQPVYYFAYPKGYYSGGIISEVKKSGFRLGFSMDDAEIGENSDKFTLPRVGIVRSHTFREFLAVISPSVISVRKAARFALYQKYLISLSL